MFKRTKIMNTFLDTSPISLFGTSDVVNTNERRVDQEMKSGGRTILWLSTALEFLKRAESRADQAFPLENGGSTSHEDAWPEAGVPEERFNNNDALEHDWMERHGRFQVSIANASPPLFLLLCDDQHEKPIVVLDIFRFTTS